MFKKTKSVQIEELKSLKNNLRRKYTDNYSKNVFVGDYTYGDFLVREWDNKTKLRIGKFCSIAEGVIFILGGEHRSDFTTTYPFNALVKSFACIKGHPKTKGDIIVGHDVWIGSHAKILSGVKIGNGAIIGANSLVTKDIPDYAIAAGNPIRIIRYRFDAETIKTLNQIKWWDFEPERLIKAIPMLQNSDVKKFIETFR